MRTTRQEIQSKTTLICNKLNKLTGGIYYGKKGHFEEACDKAGISFYKDGEDRENKVIDLPIGNTHEKATALQAMYSMLWFIEDNQRYNS